MQLTTSKRISLSFALYTFCIVFFFGVANNISFFQQWYKSEMTRLQIGTLPEPLPLRGRFQRAVVQALPANPELLALLQEQRVIYNISKIDDEYVLFVLVGPTVRVSIVTRLVHAQRDVLVSTIILLCVFAAVTYILALFLVRSSLRPVKDLVAYVDKLTLNTLDRPVPLSGPENDEIRKIAQALQNTLYLLKEQTDSLKDFVSHASHELKTPLMALSSTLDVAHKTGDYASAFPRLKKMLSDLNSLFEMLLDITQWEHKAVKRNRIDLRPLLEQLHQELSAQYSDKKIHFEVNLEDVSVMGQEEFVRSIFFNLIQNAYKYTPEHGKITITLTSDKCVISNSGPGIAREDHPKIWQRFWKHHSNGSQEGFGLGLYLVKLLVTKLEWDIQVSSEENLTSFSITYAH